MVQVESVSAECFEATLAGGTFIVHFTELAQTTLHAWSSCPKSIAPVALHNLSFGFFEEFAIEIHNDSAVAKTWPYSSLISESI